MIVSFGDRATEDLHHNRPTGWARRLPRDIVDVALVKMDLSTERLRCSTFGLRRAIDSRP